jgi:pimeloyl-ACP methyl ester carboxylesterase
MGASEGDSRDALAGEIFDADLTALLDTVGFEQPAIVTGSVGGPRVIRFSDTHSERVSALVLFDTYAHYVQEDDYPWGIRPENIDGPVTHGFSTVARCTKSVANGL